MGERKMKISKMDICCYVYLHFLEYLAQQTQENCVLSV